MWTEYIIPASLDEVLRILGKEKEKARVIAGATDLMLELERGIRPPVECLVDITRLPDLNTISIDKDEVIHIGPLVTHNQAAASPLLRERLFPLVSACWQVGAPQIRNRGTIAGNLVTASPANDTITPLIALSASLTLASNSSTRTLPLVEFYTGVRRTVLHPDEMLVDISVPALPTTWRGTFLKLGLRRAQAISVVNACVILEMTQSRINKAAITLGAVAPTIIHSKQAEDFLMGKELTDAAISEAGELSAGEARPIDDLRGSAAYRLAMVRVLVIRALRQLREATWRESVPEKPVLLQTDEEHRSYLQAATKGEIHTRINGRAYTFKTGWGKSLLRLLREEAGLTGTKEGCAEGECGACTVIMDGKAVMACLVPAPRANGADIRTIEGLADASTDNLHPVQQAFIEDGAVQCGYCTPGFIMSAVKLLEEHPQPTRQEITQALSGNLCRCTGYYKIIQAVEDAARKTGKDKYR